MRIWLLILFSLLTKTIYCQDSAAAIYISGLIQKIEGRITTDIVEKKDTSIFDEGDSLHKGPILNVRTEFYTDPQSMLLDKIVEKSVYKKITTEITVYFFGNQPICFTNKQWEGRTSHIDFDIYYISDNPVFVVKRNELKGTPDGSLFLKWCYQLRADYVKIVQDYDRTFVRRK
jgi:hypothetical protein